MLAYVPQEDVDLLVQDIQRQHAEGIVLLDASGSSVFVEGTLGHTREYLQLERLRLKGSC